MSLLNWKQAIVNNAALLDFVLDAAGNPTNAVEQKKLAFTTNISMSKLEIILNDGYTGFKGHPAPGTPLYGQNFKAFVGVLMHTLSRGNVHFTSSDISAPPLIKPKCFSSEYEIQAVIEIGKYSGRMPQMEPFMSPFVSEYEPGLDTMNTDEK